MSKFANFPKEVREHAVRLVLEQQHGDRCTITGL